VVKSAGDGILATFDGPARAVRCATERLDDAAAQGITRRAGLHTGEIEIRPTDVTGIAVHTANRVAALAGPREVLVSRTVVDLTAGSGLHVEPRGEHQLKGVPAPGRPSPSCQAPEVRARPRLALEVTGVVAASGGVLVLARGV
jgi:class 3 adenylate cyclase